MNVYTDWTRFRLGLLIGIIYAATMNGVSYAAGMQGVEFPGKNLGMILAMSLYFGMGWWTARDARTQTEGASQGLSLGFGIGVGALIIALPLTLYFMRGGTPIVPWVIFFPLAIFGELKWAFIGLVAGRMRAKKNTPLP